MNYLILHESSHRIRISVPLSHMSMREADILEYYLQGLSFVIRASVDERTGDAVIFCESLTVSKERLFHALDSFSFTDENVVSLVPEHTGRVLDRQYQNRLVWKILGKAFRMLFFPLPLQIAWTMAQSVCYLTKGLNLLLRGRLEVPVLDAAAILASMLRTDFDTASNVMFLLDVGSLLEEWTHRKSVGDLACSMSLKVDKVWMRTDAGQDVLVPVRQVKTGDSIVVYTSNVIPLDGKVKSGEASVNQASMTGESVPVVKHVGGYVYAGTVVEEGECVIEVTQAAGSGKYDQIVRMIEESEKLKSATEEKAYHLADSLVPWALGGTAVTWLFTRSVPRAISFLMVDFSCALKLAMPLAVLSAIREASRYDISVKGGKFLEAAAEADTIVFDKTGTLTHADPKVIGVYAFGGMPERDALRVAACLEEHYPHSIANAVVAAAAERGLEHEEFHSKVEYVVAHGISSMVEGERVLIGSHHFIIEDEGCTPPDERIFRHLPKEYSHLYLAIGGEVAAVICIEDPLRDEAADVVNKLHECGISRVVMMTGDNERTAKAVAEKVGVNEYHAEVLPEDKAAFIKAEHEAGRKVITIGDGVNDSPALSEADAGIAISTGAAIAREIADITISADDLYALVELKRLSNALMKRIGWNYRTIIGFNGGLIGLGVLGILPPATSALLHNASTLAIGLRSMTELK